MGHWQPGMGDPSFMGWLTVFSYYLCAGLSLACALKFWSRMTASSQWFRASSTLLIFAFGLSKQFNLPGAVTEIGRIAVQQLGGYEMRRWLQGFILALAICGLILGIRWCARHKTLTKMWEYHAPEIICLIYLYSLFILRAVSLHATGALFSAEILGVRVNWIVELAGIYALTLVLVFRSFAGTSKQS